MIGSKCHDWQYWKSLGQGWPPDIAGWENWYIARECSSLQKEFPSFQEYTMVEKCQAHVSKLNVVHFHINELVQGEKVSTFYFQVCVQMLYKKLLY